MPLTHCKYLITGRIHLMIHTINIRKRLTKEEYIHIKETYNLLPDINCFKHVPKTRLNLPNDSEKYISISVFEYHAPNMRITYYINAFLDLHKLADHTNLHKFFTPKDVQTAIKNFDDIICSELGKNYLIENWELSRIDFSIDIPFKKNNDDDIVQHYIDLLNKTTLDKYDNKHYKNGESFYLVPDKKNNETNKTKKPRVNFYHKYKKFENDMNTSVYKPSLTDYVLRLEVQYPDAKYIIKELNGGNKKKNNPFPIQSSFYKNFLSPEDLPKLLLNSLQSIYDKKLKELYLLGDFYTLDEAIKIIDNHIDPASPLKNRNLTFTYAKNLKKVLRDISDSSSIEAYKRKRTTPNKKTIKEYFEVLNDLNISPVLISDEESQKWNTTHLEGLHTKLDQVISQYIWEIENNII